MDQYFTWHILGTFAGCAAATGLLTQCFKKMFKKLPTPCLSFIIAVLILVGAMAFTSGFSPSSIALIPINATLVSFSSNGAFAAMKRMNQGKNVPPPADPGDPPPQE